MTGSISHLESTLRHVTFETGAFDENVQANIGGVIVSPGLVGNHAGSFTSQYGNPAMVVLSLWSWDPTLPTYKEMYYDCQVKFPDGFSVPQWQMIFEVNAPHPISGSEHVELMVGNRNGVTNNVMLQFYSQYSARGYDLPYAWGIQPEGSGENRVYEMRSGVAMLAGQVVRFEVYYKTDMVNGVISVKMNGVEILHYTGRTQFDPELNPDTGLMHNNISTVWGNYVDPTQPSHTMIMDEIYVGTKPNPYATPPPI